MESLQKISSKNNWFYVFIRSRPKNYRKITKWFTVKLYSLWNASNKPYKNLKMDGNDQR